ncbi:MULTISPECIES: PhaM family polyhydroxyalkanoate granule multifunctional regulatory protein [unclassified Simplicispira]|uniref:PhaM family polyhydroxyalkanoate granule multifunctional regulatory protein n=1 Tax=unclassified Simplicispira TaxID=2630407 RepID=UPI000D5D4201|nr:MULTISPECIES: PhaM family polyhydroxyalkanoate granule multifunctional regulatory protein [unclassified Simplicispira]MBH1977688.1 hypothetical protein [Comamonadaceae bacterium]PVY57045.1 hypothetical protein C8D04_2318 [Simplicispira sp. 125]REG17990.1 hypothetical protein C8D01_2628 [Simplicispira sp. 110]
MSDTSTTGFGKFVPGFDFLQNLAKGASSNIPQMPNLSSWVAPTINVEELEKRVDELKAVQFWLEQNSRALAATIQALEVQKMTLATLKGMNFSMGDVANAFKLKTADTVMDGVHKAGETLASAAQAVSGVAHRVSDMAAPEPAAHAAPAKKSKAAAAQAASMVDPMQWWGALTQQFQQIATDAMKDAAKQTALDTTRNLATGLAKEAFRTATGMAGQMAAKGVQSASRRVMPAKAQSAAPAPARKAAPRKAAAKKTTAAKTTARRPAAKKAR